MTVNAQEAVRTPALPTALRSAFLHPNLERFGAHAGEMDARLRARPSRGEFFALALALAMTGVFLWAHKRLQIEPFDYWVYMQTAPGNLLQYYYADWMLPLFYLWAKLPPDWGYLLWTAAGILALFFAARLFGGNAALALVSFQMFYALFLGQINALLIGALALGWWGIAHRRWNVAGLGFFVAGAKFQLGLSLGFLLWLFAEIGWRERLRMLIVPTALASLSLLLSPGWPLALLERIEAYPPYDWGSISLWHGFGPAALLLALPPLLLPLDRARRFLALAAACPLMLPYFQQTDLLALFVLPVGWLPVLLGNLGYLFFQFQFEALRWLWVAPLTVYLAILLPAAWSLFHCKAAATSSETGR